MVWIPRCCSPSPCNSPTRGRSSTCRSGTRPVASGSRASRSGTVPAPGSIAPRRNAGRGHARFTTRRNARGAIWTSSSTGPTSTRSCRAWPVRPMASGRFRCRGRGQAVGSRSCSRPWSSNSPRRGRWRTSRRRSASTTRGCGGSSAITWARPGSTRTARTWRPSASTGPAAKATGTSPWSPTRRGATWPAWCQARTRTPSRSSRGTSWTATATRTGSLR